jgi:hypothetical protein
MLASGIIQNCRRTGTGSFARGWVNCYAETTVISRFLRLPIFAWDFCFFPDASLLYGWSSVISRGAFGFCKPCSCFVMARDDEWGRRAAMSRPLALRFAAFAVVDCSRGFAADGLGSGILSGTSLQLTNLIAEQRGLLELEIIRGLQHVLFDLANGFDHVEVSSRVVEHRGGGFCSLAMREKAPMPEYGYWS